ncbi:unnamed protein product [Lymnaea stagnalis]|uniref:DNA excision repair protein ERCC-8 n=1 Tax=Lymnaea stagnalis TaxID=6523 RepID=A0AAV2HAF8_LYMST
MNLPTFTPNTMACHQQHSMTHCLIHQTMGMLAPYTLQRSISTYFMQGLELSRHKEVQTVHTAAVNDVDVDLSENRYLLSGASDGTIAIHDLEELIKYDHNNRMLDTRVFKLVHSVSPGTTDAHTRSVETVLWYALDTGIFTSSGTDRCLKVWDTNTLKVVEEYSFSTIIHSHHMSSVSTSHNLIAAGTDSPFVRLVDTRIGCFTGILKGHKEGGVRAVCWSPKDEFLLATGGIDNFAMLWDVRSAKGCLKKLQDKGKKKSGYKRDTTHDGSVNGLKFTADGYYLATIGTDQRFFMWDINTGKKLTSHYPPLSHIKKRSVKFCLTKSGRDNFAYIPTGASITTFNISSDSREKHLYGHYNSVNCCFYHECGNQLITGGNDRKILVWTRKGDKEYEDFMCDRRVELIKKNATEEIVTMPESLAQTLDTWSDDEQD